MSCKLREPDNAKQRSVRQRPVAGDERRAATSQARGELKRVGRLDAEACAQLGGEAQNRTLELHHEQPAAVGEHGLVALGEIDISGAVWDDENLEQGERRCDRLKPTRGDRLEDRCDGREMLRVLLYEVDEDRGVECDRSTAQQTRHVHERRSRVTWRSGSTPLQTSLPSPRSSRMQCGSDSSTASLRGLRTSCATGRLRRLARACSRLYRRSGTFFTLSVAIDPP